MGTRRTRRTGRLRRLAVAVVVALGVSSVAIGAMPTGAGARPLLPGKPEIALKAKRTKAGPHPVLRWEPVAGAARYVVVVQTPKGKPYWSWQGSADRVRLGGGGTDAVEGSEGARLTRKMAWYVLAFDADGNVVASSARRPISPKK